jgi:hypothetical protein
MVKKLASLPDWRLVVVADKKTPTDWFCENGVFLTPEDQCNLPYKIIKHLPFNNYSRKNIGYLYAIEHGATIIYDTDDDNMPMGDNVAHLPEHTTALQYCTGAGTVNIYEHFGQPCIWPRGYPLTAITQPVDYTLISEKVFIPVQQGCVNKAPDVDAIFRLTQDRDVTFCDVEPVTLPKHVMCPFNSQNTIFYRSAFWGLLIPTTPTMREADIWRGYVVQRLLWDMQASLCFLPATAIQYRNLHNLLRDFKDEIGLYTRTEEMINILNAWQSDKPSFKDRMQEAYELLVKYGFFKPSELDVLQAWFDDLSKLNYTMPQLQ